ncbi:MAG TPA: pyruvate kinase [Candidatus Andersenbacteria bacterium]|nr:pyruvate kinase [Candidatus Andersenbacteria bacterium]
MRVVNRAKIVATLGPASASQATVREIIAAGADVARINFSHGTSDANLELMRLWREGAKASGRALALMQDLQGTKLRIGRLREGQLELLEGSLVSLLTGAAQTDNDMIPVPEGRLPTVVRRGDRILLRDGQLELEVIGVEGRRVDTRVLLGGTLGSHQGLTVPSARWPYEELSDKDKHDLGLGLSFGVDLVALSFVRRAEDVVALRAVMQDLLGDGTELPGVIVKIENHEALENFAAILEQADGVMIARGDLGLDTSISALPVTQKELIAKCVVAGKPVVVATQMLASMGHSPRPTRAEVSDVANAVLDYADALMLSDETAMGRYPVRSVAQMAEVIATTEAAPLRGLLPEMDSESASVPQAVAAAAVQLARHVAASAILVVTHTGYSARSVARFRWDIPIYAATDSPQVQRMLALSWGITPLLVEGYREPENMLRRALEHVRTQRQMPTGSRVVVVSGLRRERGFDSAVRVVEL